MKKIFMAAILCCATTVVNAQNTVKEKKKMVRTNLQIAEQKVKLADANPTDGQKQYAAATALVGIAVLGYYTGQMYLDI